MRETEKLSDQLQQACLFREMDDEQRGTLLGLMVAEQFAAEEVIIRQETVTRNLWLVLEGNCSVVKQPPLGTFGQEVQLAELKSLDVFGEMTLVLNAPHVASVEAKSEVQTLRLRGEQFDSILDTHPRIACQLLSNLVYILSQRLRSVDEKLSQQLDRRDELAMQENWRELRNRLGKLYAGSPNL